MQPFITYMQQLNAGAILAWGGMICFGLLGIWGFVKFISSAAELYAAMGEMRAKERK